MITPSQKDLNDAYIDALHACGRDRVASIVSMLRGANECGQQMPFIEEVERTCKIPGHVFINVMHYILSQRFPDWMAEVGGVEITATEHDELVALRESQGHVN